MKNIKRKDNSGNTTKKNTPKENLRITIACDLWVALRSVSHWWVAFSLSKQFNALWCVYSDSLVHSFVLFVLIPFFIIVVVYVSICVISDLDFDALFLLLVKELIRFEECGNLIAWIIISHCLRLDASLYWICMHGDLLGTIAFGLLVIVFHFLSRESNNKIKLRCKASVSDFKMIPTRYEQKTNRNNQCCAWTMRSPDQ